MLALAAVAGAEFELDMVRRTAFVPDAVVLEAVDEAVDNGLLVEEPGPRLAYRFAHELVRRAVTARLSASRKAEIHLLVAEALASGRPEGDSRAVLAALAHHYAAAAPVGGVERAVAYNLLAAESASSALAFGEAEDRFRVALELGVRDPAERADVMLRLGQVLHRAGRADGALEAFRRAAALGRTLVDAEILVRSAIGFEEACWRPAIHDAEAVELLEEAVAALDEDDSELRARVLGGLARALELRGEPGRAALARDEAIAMSRRRGDRRTLGTILAASYWARGSTSNEEINRMLVEAREIGTELEDVEIEGAARYGSCRRTSCSAITTRPGDAGQLLRARGD